MGEENGCSVTSGSDVPNDVISNILQDDNVEYACRKYMRKSYKDWMDIYPVKEVATYCFYGEIALTYLNTETMDEAKSLVESFGLEVYYEYGQRLAVIIKKDMDYFSVANQLYESGLFLVAVPGKQIITKELNTQPIDKSNLPWHYNYYGNKTYWYDVADRLMVIKTSATTKTDMESVIRKYIEESEILWDNDSTCTVVTNPANVDAAFTSLLQEESVSRVSRMYFNISTYEFDLSQGLRDPECFGLNGQVTFAFKEGISDSEKSQIINDYNLNVLIQRTYGTYYAEVPKADDPLSVSKSIYETGLVDFSEPCTMAEVRGARFWESYRTTAVKAIANEAQETSVQYFDLLGHKVAAPSGLTIEVKRYSDGTVRTEKKLFR